jgi:hypothetical protein
MNKLSFFLILLLLCSTIICCNDNNYTSDNLNQLQYKSTGQIVGRDLALCPCCGNWVLKVDGVQNTYQFLTLPANSGIDLNTATFPITVKFNWSIDETAPCKYALIESIALN